MPVAMTTFTFDEHQLGDIKVMLVLAIIALLAVALYERWPKWRE